MKYIVYYKIDDDSVKIGEYIKENEYVKYTVDKDEIKKLNKMGYQLYSDVTENYEGKSFPFFDNRIKNCSRFDDEIIGYHTDPFFLIKENKNN